MNNPIGQYLDFRRKLTDFWDHMAPEYDRSTRLNLERNQWVEERLQVLFPGQSNLKIADIGTGCGFMAISYALSSHDVTATDISTEMISHAKSIAEDNGVEIDFRNDDVMECNLTKGYYDLVVLRDVLSNIYDAEKALLNLISLLRPGGIILISDGNYFLYRHADDYRKRQLFYSMKTGENEYASMLNMSGEAFAELESLIADLPINEVRHPFWETQLLMDNGMNNARIRYEDREEFFHLTDSGPVRTPLRCTLSAQKPYGGGQPVLQNNDERPFYYRSRDYSVEEVSNQFKALAHRERIILLEMLEKRSYSVSELTKMVGCSENRTSYHLGILKDAGFVKSERRGREIYYSLVDDSAIGFLISLAHEFYIHRRSAVTPHPMPGGPAKSSNQQVHDFIEVIEVSSIRR